MRRIALVTLKAFLISSSAWLLAAVLCVVAAYLYLNRDVTLENYYIASQTIRDVESISSKINTTSMALSDPSLLNCSASSRRTLRGYVFENSGISDIGIYGERGVACTAMIGNLPAEAIDPDNYIPITENGRIWPSRDLLEDDGIDSSLAIATSKLIYFIEPLPIEESQDSSFLWEIVYTGDSPYTISGTEGLYRNFTAENGSLSGIVSEECSESLNVCILVMRPWKSILGQHYVVLIVLSLVALMLGFWFSSLIRWLLDRSTTASVRTLSAVSKGSFHCAYQPIVDIGTGGIVGCEVLARLEDRYGPLSPAEFIPVIAENELMNDFSKMMFDRAYSGIRGIQWPGTKPFKFSFNIFPANLNSEMVQFFKTHPALSDDRLQVCLEVTEDSSISDTQYQKTIEQFNRIGIEISVDDFGTGYGNMSRLQSSHLSYLKVDKSLISHLTPENSKASLTSYIPMIADNSGLQIVAEGIETVENLAAVKSLNMQYGQGFYFSRPLPSSDFIELVASGKTWGVGAEKGKIIELADKLKVSEKN